MFFCANEIPADRVSAGCWRWALSSVLLFCLSLPVMAEVYQWRDEDGRVHYSDKKPKHLQAKDITESVKKVNVDQSSAERGRVERVFSRETDVERAHRQRQQQQQTQQKQKFADQCERARYSLRRLEGRVVFVREDGSEEKVSEKERERRAEAFQRQIEQHCGGASSVR